MPRTIAATETADTRTASLREKFAALEREARRAWRQAAFDLAAGKPGPRPEEILRLAGILEIADPAAALDADVDAVREAEPIERAIEVCRRTRDEILVPWGGDVAALEAAVAEAEAKLATLRESLKEYRDGCSIGFWQNNLLHHHRAHPRLWGAA